MTDGTSTTERLRADLPGLARATELLRTGGLVAFPTETVYGLGARADDARAIERLFAAKGRPADNPLIVHVASVEAMDRVAAEVTPLARALVERFSPGPLTVVLRARPELPRAVTAGLDSVAVRIPDHPVALALLRALDLPVAAPSANRSSRPSPTTAAHVLADLDGAIDAVVDGGATQVGLESTVIDARGAHPVVLRDGVVTREDLELLLGDTLLDERTESQRSPGTRHAHYSPGLPVHVAAPGEGDASVRMLLDGRDGPGRIGLVRVGRGGGGGERAAGTRGGAAERPEVVLLADLEGATDLAAQLFALMRRAEDDGCDALVIEGVVPTGVGRAVMDRLERAARASSEGD